MARVMRGWILGQGLFMGTKVWGLRFWSYAALKQWGFATSTTTGVRVDFPINFQSVLYGIQESHRADLSSDQKTAVIAGANLTGFGLYNSGTTGYGFNWLAYGK